MIVTRRLRGLGDVPAGALADVVIPGRTYSIKAPVETFRIGEARLQQTLAVATGATPQAPSAPSPGQGAVPLNNPGLAPGGDPAALMDPEVRAEIESGEPGSFVDTAEDVACLSAVLQGMGWSPAEAAGFLQNGIGEFLRMLNAESLELVKQAVGATEQSVCSDAILARIGAERRARQAESWFAKNKTMVLVAGGVLGVLGIALVMRKRKR